MPLSFTIKAFPYFMLINRCTELEGELVRSSGRKLKENLEENEEKKVKSKAKLRPMPEILGAISH